MFSCLFKTLELFSTFEGHDENVAFYHCVSRQQGVVAAVLRVEAALPGGKPSSAGGMGATDARTNGDGPNSGGCQGVGADHNRAERKVSGCG